MFFFLAHYPLFVIKKGHYSLIIIPHPDPHMCVLYELLLLEQMLYVPVNDVSVMAGHFLGCTSTKQGNWCRA